MGTRRFDHGLLRLVLILSLPLAEGCIGTSGSARTLDQYAERRRAESAETLASRLNEFANRFSAVTEEAADEVIALTKDPRARREALLWKVDAISLCDQACFRPNPIGGLYDVWTLCAQLREYFAEGPGKDALGERRDIAVAACDGLLASADALSKTVFSGEEGLSVEGIFAEGGDFESKAAEIRKVAKELAIQGRIASRLSPLERFARYVRTEQGALSTVVTLEGQLHRIERRMGIYATHLPKLARWQAELLVAESLEDPTISGVTRSLIAVDEHAASVAGSLRNIEQTILKEVALVLDRVSEERKAVVDSIGVQRVEILRAVTQERIGALEAISAERAAATSALDASLARTVNDVFSRMDDRVDRALPWLVPVGVAVLMLLALVAWAAGRRRILRVELPRDAASRPANSGP